MSPALRGLFEACKAAGGRALLVGGSVRDALLGRPSKDFDVEVHGLDMDALHRVLTPLGRVNEVGRSFGVLKVRLRGARHAAETAEIDVALPRRDSREGPGHRGIRATADPDLGVREAARRRDLTINAIAWDPLLDRFEDPFDGIGDLRAGVLRAVDAATFGEDPLRALRVAQFAARFEFDVDPVLERLCAEMPLHELPAERIRGEVEKLLLRARRPSVGWAFAQRTSAWAKVLPEWDRPASELDRCAAIDVPPPVSGRRLALMLAAASLGLTEAETERGLDRLGVYKQDGYAVRKQVLFLVGRYDEARAGLDATACRRLAEVGEVGLLALLADRPDACMLASALGVLREPLPPLLGGRDLHRLGLPPGPAMGSILAALREEQLTGRVGTSDEALGWLKSRLVEDRGPA